MNKKEKNTEKYITELEDKIVELSLRLKTANNELSSNYRTNKNLVSNLTHNLKNPVGVIYSFSEMIAEDFEQYSTEKFKKHLNVINKSAEFSLALLNSFEKFSQLQSPSLKFNFSRLNYIELLSNVVSQFNSLATKRSCILKTKFPVNEVFLKAEKDQLTEALTNIIKNAFRYSPDNSTITIVVNQYANVVETEIIDEGIGISHEDLSTIFKEFYVVNTYSEDKQKCIGLGLAIANKIIQHHKGEIKVISTLGKGSSFKISLPA